VAAATVTTATIIVTTAAITGGIILIGMAIAITAAGIGIIVADTMEVEAVVAAAAAMRPLRPPKNPAVEGPSVNSS
jgi:hypothetical protein